ncbi:hypothetical protein VNO78_03469 [Psophocarpus tetragonolobus]|uniref:Uncharacterized protein n=1 Tax=Psophocarpus tetragonolobus TaxID=3891 RepID=A0AAN9XW47_PSOTE
MYFFCTSIFSFDGVHFPIFIYSPKGLARQTHRVCIGRNFSFSCYFYLLLLFAHSFSLLYVSKNISNKNNSNSHAHVFFSLSLYISNHIKYHTIIYASQVISSFYYLLLVLSYTSKNMFIDFPFVLPQCVLKILEWSGSGWQAGKKGGAGLSEALRRHSFPPLYL